MGLISNIQKQFERAGKPVPSPEEIRDLLIQQEYSKGSGNNYAMSSGGVDADNPLLKGL